MRWLFAALLILIAGIAAQGELITTSTGGGGGTFPPAGCVTANAVIFNNATPCDAGLVKVAGATGQVTSGGNILLSGASYLTSDHAFPSAINLNNSAVGFARLATPTTLLAAAGDFGNGQAGFFARSASCYWISSQTDASGTIDTGLCRQGAGVLEVSTTTPNAAGSLLTTGLTASGTVTFSGLGTGTNADFLCLSAGGVVLIQASACTISSLRFKSDWKLFEEDAIAYVRRLDVGTFHFDSTNQSDPNGSSLQVGLNAENVASVIPEAAIYENDMKTPKSYRQESVIAILVKALQQQQSEIDELKRKLR